MTDLLSGRRILVVEDEMMVLMMIEGMLGDLGCDDIVSAATIEQALSVIGAQAFDAACLDVNLNGRESYPIADALAAAGVPFAFSTGYSDHDGGERHRGRPVLTKPYHFRQFTKVFTDLISGPPSPVLAAA